MTSSLRYSSPSVGFGNEINRLRQMDITKYTSSGKAQARRLNQRRASIEILPRSTARQVASIHSQHSQQISLTFPGMIFKKTLSFPGLHFMHSQKIVREWSLSNRTGVANPRLASHMRLSAWCPVAPTLMMKHVFLIYVYLS